VVLVYLQPFHRNSVLKCALHPKIAKNSLKPVFGSSNLKKACQVLLIISSMSVPICNRFHIIRVNNGKITSLRGTPLCRPRSRGTPLIQGARNFVTKTRDLEATHGKDFVILACTVLTQYSSVTNGRTDRRSGHG